jgi:hypothetical protein
MTKEQNKAVHPSPILLSDFKAVLFCFFSLLDEQITW